jgi:hypothetical protein
MILAAFSFASAKTNRSCALFSWLSTLFKNAEGRKSGVVLHLVTRNTMLVPIRFRQRGSPCATCASIAHPRSPCRGALQRVPPSPHRLYAPVIRSGRPPRVPNPERQNRRTPAHKLVALCPLGHQE